MKLIPLHRDQFVLHGRHDDAASRSAVTHDVATEFVRTRPEVEARHQVRQEQEQLGTRQALAQAATFAWRQNDLLLSLLSILLSLLPMPTTRSTYF